MYVKHKEVYSVKTGREALQGWLESPPSFSPPRNELLLKLFFGHHSSPKQLSAHVEQYRQSYQETLTTFKGTERWLETEFAGHPSLPYWLMTLSHGRLGAEALLKWCDETLVTLSTLDARSCGLPRRPLAAPASV